MGTLQPPLGFSFAQLEELIVSSSRAAWEVHFKAPDQVGADMAEFAIGSISTMARTNRKIQVDSLVPHLGSHLEVKWYYVIPLVAGICGAHLVLFISNRSAT